MKILWFPRLQSDIDKLHVTTWREMRASLENAGHRVTIALCGNAADVGWNRQCINIPIIRIKIFRSLSFWVNGFFKFIAAVIKEKPDVIILDIFSIWFSAPLLIVSRSVRPLLIVDNRTPLYAYNSGRISIRDRVMRAYTRLSHNYARSAIDGITVITGYYKKYLCKKYNFEENRVAVWSSGVNIDKFNAGAGLGRDENLKNRFLLFQHGEVSYNRGLFETVKALKIISDLPVYFMSIGQSIKSEAQNELARLAEKLELGERLIAKPPVSHEKIPQYIAQSDCAIMAYPNIEYWNNNNPIKLLEYLAMGKCIICTDMWTFRDVMGDAPCAIYIKDNSPETIAQAIITCYKNKDKLESWGKSGIDIVKERFTWDKQADSLLEFIRRLKNENITNVRT